MFRKSALAMAMLGALGTAQVGALGLGDIELKSALNQPLNAEVELLSATREELQELKVEIASPQAFANAGIERTLFLNKLQFDVVTNAEGKPVVRISSRDVVREPFLDFLLEVAWSKGRLLREYTVLVDPPVTMPAPAPALQAPAAQPAPASAPVAAARRATHTAQLPPVSVAPGQYETRRNDTLWQIAEQVRPDAGVSIEQTMLGLLQANPDAFYNNNINNLKAGHILRVPSREELTRISKGEASREARRQYAEWRQAQNLPAPDAPADVAPTASGPAETAAESRLELVAPELSEGDSAADAAGLEALQNELMIANEALEAQRRQGEDMSTRLSALEEQIQNMQRLIQLKDDELARLQAQVGKEATELLAEGDEVAGVEAQEGEAVVDEAVMAEAGLAPEEPVAEEMGAEQPVFGAETAAEFGDQDVSIPPQGVAADGLDAEGAAEDAAAAEVAPEPVEPLVDQVEEPAVAETAPVAEPAVETQPALPVTATTPGFVDRLVANPLWLGAGAAVLALLGFLALRRKRSGETEFQESILQAAREKSVQAADSEIIAAESESAQSTTTASSLLSEFAVSDMGSMKSDGEADPLAEADVYLAYGRYQQAEDLITEALQNDPEHPELNLKLMEVYQAAQNQTAFDEHAQAILGRLESSEDPLWEKIAEMGRELSPGNPLYQSGAAAPAEQAQDEGELTAWDSGLDAAMQAGEESPAQPSAEAEKISELEEGLEFDMGLSPDAAEEQDEFKPDSVEFTPPESSVAEEKMDAEIGGIEPDSIDLGQDNTLEFDLEGLNLGAEEEAELPGDGELADLDEVSTKLDLARAYLDMGDPEGARSILDEVIEEGSVDQKTEAQQILDKIA